MGFTTGFIGGLTATYTLLYLSLHLHRTNRQHQSLLLTQQKALLTSLTSPQAPISESPAYEVRKAGVAEELKDRWNREVEGVVRNLQTTDWTEVRVRWEKRLGNVWQNIRTSEKGQVLEERFQEKVAKIDHGTSNLDLEGGKEAVFGRKSAATAVNELVGDARHGKRLLELK